MSKKRYIGLIMKGETENLIKMVSRNRASCYITSVTKVQLYTSTSRNNYY